MVIYLNLNLFLFLDNKVPGPGEYTPKISIDGTGSIYSSRYKSNIAKSIGGRLKELSNKNVTPGPGSYMAFSEFGYNYDSRFAAKLKASQERINNNIKNKSKRESNNTKNKNQNHKDNKNNNRDYMRYFQIKEEVNFF